MFLSFQGLKTQLIDWRKLFLNNQQYPLKGGGEGELCHYEKSNEVCDL